MSITIVYLRVSTLYVCVYVHMYVYVLDNTHQLTDIWKFTLNLSIHLLVSQNMKHKYEQPLKV